MSVVPFGKLDTQVLFIAFVPKELDRTVDEPDGFL